MFGYVIKKIAVNFFKFLSIAIWVPFVFLAIWPFINSAITKNCIGFPTVGFVLYALILLLLAICLTWSPMYFIDKAKLIQGLCYAMSALLIIEIIADLVTYKAFIGYEFVDGDPIFVNIITNSPGWPGVIMCFALAVLYFFFGKLLLTDRKWPAFVMYLLIFFMTGIMPIIYSIPMTHIMLRVAWLKKALFIIPHQFFVLIALIVSMADDDLWATNLQ